MPIKCDDCGEYLCGEWHVYCEDCQAEHIKTLEEWEAYADQLEEMEEENEVLHKRIDELEKLLDLSGAGTA